MTVSGVNNSGSVGAADAFALPNSLTAESLLLYCQSQLGNIDNEISGYLNQQKRAIAEKQILSDLKNTLSKYQPPKTEAQKMEVVAAYGQAKAKLNDLGLGDGELAGKINDSFKSLFPSGNIDVAVLVYGAAASGLPVDTKATLDTLGTWSGSSSKEGWSSTLGDVTNVIEELSGNAEINMIQLQSLMSKRQTAVQLTTNMLAKHDQTVGSILNNMK